jgi:hypothetical protein
MATHGLSSRVGHRHPVLSSSSLFVHCAPTQMAALAWIMKTRPLMHDYVQLNGVAEMLVTIAAVSTMVRRWP